MEAANESRIRNLLFHGLSTKELPCDESPDQKSTFTDVVRVPQVDTWDCGVACLLMVYYWFQGCQDMSEVNVEEKREELFSQIRTKSIWTSDLLLLLHSWKIGRGQAEGCESMMIANPKARKDWNRFHFALASQQLMDVDESYRSLEYYQMSFDEDRMRVAKTFRNLRSQGVSMIQTDHQSIRNTEEELTESKKPCAGDSDRGKLSLATLLEVIQRDDCIAMVLLDNSVLLARQNNVKSDRVDGRPIDRKYAGHYVILCGISWDPRHVDLANRTSIKSGPNLRSTLSLGKDNLFANGKDLFEDSPVTEANFCLVLCNPDPFSHTLSFGALGDYMFVTPKRFEASWRAKGTDEDIIFLRSEKRRTLQSGISGNKRPWYSMIDFGKHIPLAEGSMMDKTGCDDTEVLHNRTAADPSTGNNKTDAAIPEHHLKERRDDSNLFSLIKIPAFLRELYLAMVRFFWT